MNATEVTFRLPFTTHHHAAAGVYIGSCPALRIYSQGTTLNEAETAVVGAAQLFLAVCYDRNILHTILRSRGIKRAAAVPGSGSGAKNLELISNEPQQDRVFWRDVSINLLTQEAA